MLDTVNIVTDNVARELLRIATQNSIPVSQLSLKINSINTFVKDKESEFLEIYGKDIDKYTDEETLRDETIEFWQEYDCNVRVQDPNDPFKDMQCTVELEENGTLAYLIIQQGSKLNYYEDLFDDFIDFIMAQQIRAGVMVYLFDVDYEKTIQEFVNVLKQIKKITFKENKKILLSKGVREIKSVNAKTLMTIEENNNIGSEDKKGRVDYANRGFLLSCVEGEELFEFIKPQQGKNGRNCRGKIIEAEIVNLDAKPTFTTEDSIEVQESFENIKYLSCKSGYLIKKGNAYDVSNSIDVSEISFKTTGTINTDLDSEISINVIKDNPLEDAIEEGMHVKVQNLSISGSIGPNTKIESRTLSITGQTHNDSSIKCVNAEIGVHKGKVIAREVEVGTLEGGEIIADTAIVKNAMSGKIRAKTIEIHQLGSHVTLEASAGIQIEKVRGEENKFIIDPLIGGGFDDTKEDDQAFLEKLKEELKDLLKTLKESTEKVKRNLEPCEKIKAAIIKSKDQGIKISPTLIQKFQLCKVMKVHYKKLREDVEYKKNQYAKFEKKFLNSGSNIFDAHITLAHPLKGFNHIIYRVTKPQMEIKLSTNESMNKKVFKLIEDDEGILRIVNVNE